MATQYVKDEGGSTFIAASQRPDGSWRKQRKVKDGFVPQEEVPLYESKGKKLLKDAANALPAGLTPEIWEQMKQQQKEMKKVSSVKSENVTPKASKQLSTGLTVEDTNEWKTVSSKKKKKNRDCVSSCEVLKSVKHSVPLFKPVETESAKVVNEAGQPLTTDPAKRLRNLRKKLREIEALKQKPREQLEKEQLEKIARVDEVIRLIDELEIQIENFS